MTADYWTALRDAAAIMTPFMIAFIMILHKSNINRLEHLDNCIDKMREEVVKLRVAVAAFLRKDV